MMQRRLAILAFLLVACGQPRPADMSSSLSRSPSPAAASTTPNTVADMPVTAVDFSCRLPVVRYVPVGDSVTYQGEFIAFPAGQLTEGAAGRMQSQDVKQEDVATVAAPVLHGNGGFPFYDRARSRWVPAPSRQTLADGSAYAYVAANLQAKANRVKVVNVASGEVRAFDLSSSERLQVADYRGVLVYLLAHSALGDPGEGVWLLDSGTAAVTQQRIHQVWMVRDGNAWVARFDSRDKTVWPPSELAPANSLVRIDLTTGSETVWFYRAGTYPWLLGLDSHGRPLLSVQSATGGRELRLIDTPGASGLLIYSGDAWLGEPHGDGDRIWFRGKLGIYSYRPDRGLQRVFAFDSTPFYLEPAGFCL